MTNAEYIKKKIYLQTCRLTPYFLDFIKREGVPENLLPLWDDYCAYRCDWNIIGGEEAKKFFEPYYRPINKKYFLTVEQRFEIQKWLIRTSRKLFLPELMVGNSVTTDGVHLRICTSLLEKLNIPKQYKDYIFDNMLYCYWTRKRAYDSFYWKEIVEFPFAPSFHVEN